MKVCPNLGCYFWGKGIQISPFCSECGSELVEAPTCKCGELVYANMKFCGGCGQPAEGILDEFAKGSKGGGQ